MPMSSVLAATSTATLMFFVGANQARRARDARILCRQRAVRARRSTALAAAIEWHTERSVVALVGRAVEIVATLALVAQSTVTAGSCATWR
jgi:hypothetical protein